MAQDGSKMAPTTWLQDGSLGEAWRCKTALALDFVKPLICSKHSEKPRVGTELEAEVVPIWHQHCPRWPHGSMAQDGARMAPPGELGDAKRLLLSTLESH
eukprot:9467014-Pyramimonas_sp.AAC.1